MNNHYDQLETRSKAERERSLLENLKAQLAHAKTHAPYYTRHLKDVDQLASMVDLAKLPLTRKSDLLRLQQEQPPFAGLVANNSAYAGNVFASPGPIYEPGYTRADYWRFARCLYAAGFRAGDLVLNCFSYHLSPAGAMAETGCHALGCTVIPAGVGQTELQIRTIDDLRPNGYVGTPSFLKILLQRAQELGKDVGCFSRALVSGEAFPASFRAYFSEHGIYTVECYATADLGLIAYESSADSGLIVDEGVYLEIVRPGTNQPVADGEVGEVVVTSFNPEYPLIRFATGDLSAVLDGQSPCGRSNVRIKGWMGRADQTAKVRGMFVRPEQIHQIIQQYSQINRARLIVDWVDERDQMTLLCESESNSPDLAKQVATSIRDVCKVRGEVEFVAPGSIHNDGLVIEDIRNYD